MSFTVLVVDDDAAFRGLAVRMLTGWGYAVVGEAGTTADAERFAVELRPDGALVDVGLPDGDGFALARRLVALPWALRVVLISIEADRAGVRAAQRAGARGFLAKDELSGQRLHDLLQGV